MDQLNQNSSFPSYHTHNGADGTPQLDESTSIKNTRRYVILPIVPSTNSNTVTSTIGGDFVMPFDGYVTEVGATVDTAGVTGTMQIDINKNGTSILTTKITIDSTKKTSRTATTPAVIDTSMKGFSVGDIFTFDVDTIQTTPAKGLKVFINCIKT